MEDEQLFLFVLYYSKLRRTAKGTGHEFDLIRVARRRFTGESSGYLHKRIPIEFSPYNLGMVWVAVGFFEEQKKSVVENIPIFVGIYDSEEAAKYALENPDLEELEEFRSSYKLKTVRIFNKPIEEVLY